MKVVVHIAAPGHMAILSLATFAEVRGVRQRKIRRCIRELHRKARAAGNVPAFYLAEVKRRWFGRGYKLVGAGLPLLLAFGGKR